MSETIVYEQPLNERIRGFLRLEYLFEIIKQRREGITQLDTRDTINAMIDVIELLSRSDIKSDLIKELERHVNTLSILVDNPSVDQNQLNSILKDIHLYLGRLHDPEFQPGKLFSRHELITSVKQRSVITGGSCNFDLPSYHFWLHKSVESKNNLIEQLYDDFSVINKSIQLCLHILRNSASADTALAKSGFFQKNIDSNLDCQLIRIELDHNSLVYPEISAGKHRFSIRFMAQDNPELRSAQTNTDVDFILHCCIV